MDGNGFAAGNVCAGVKASVPVRPDISLAFLENGAWIDGFTDDSFSGRSEKLLLSVFSECGDAEIDVDCEGVFRRTGAVEKETAVPHEGQNASEMPNRGRIGKTNPH